MIYVMGEGRTGVVKIGMAVNPVERLKQIQTGYPMPLSLQLALPGGRDEESWLHRRFAALRVSEREWFDFGSEDAVTAVVAALVSGEDDLLSDEIEDPARRRPASPPELRTNLPGTSVYVLDEAGRPETTGTLYQWNRDPDGCWVARVRMSTGWEWIGAAALIPGPTIPAN